MEDFQFQLLSIIKIIKFRKLKEQETNLKQQEDLKLAQKATLRELTDQKRQLSKSLNNLVEGKPIETINKKEELLKEVTFTLKTTREEGEALHSKLLDIDTEVETLTNQKDSIKNERSKLVYTKASNFLIRYQKVTFSEASKQNE